MADEVLNLQIQINAETGQLEVVSKGFENAGKQAKKAEDSFSGLSKGASDVLKTLGLVASATTLTKFFIDAVKLTQAFNEAIQRVEFNLKALGLQGELSRNELIKWGKAVQDNTRFADSQAIETLNKFIRATGDVKQSQSAAMLAMDLSVASGKDLAQTTELITNLMLGNQRAVLEANREYGAFVGKGKDTQTILDNLQKSLGGAAEKEEGFAKTTEQLKNKWDDFSKTIGNYLIPALLQLVKVADMVLHAFEWLGVKIAGVFARMVVNAEYGWKQLTALAKGHFEEVGRLNEEYKQAIFNVNKVVMEETEKIGDQKVEKLTKDTKLIVKISEEEAKARQKILDDEQEKAKKVTEKNTQDSMERKRKADKDTKEAIEKFLQDLQKQQDKDDAIEIKKYTELQQEKKAAVKSLADFTSQEFSKAFADVIMESKNLDEAFQQMGQNIIRMILQMIAQMTALKILTGSITGAPGAGGELGGLLGFLTRGDGGAVEAGKTYVVGEQGAEVLKMGASGGQVISNKQLRQVQSFTASSSNEEFESVQPTVNVYVNLSTENLSLDNHKLIINALASEIGRETAEGVKLAVKMRNVANRNTLKAV